MAFTHRVAPYTPSATACTYTGRVLPHLLATMLLIVAALACAILMSLPARASIAYGSINNFDCVNDTGFEAHGFDIELDDTNSKDITYTYDWNHYGVPTITNETSPANKPMTRVRYAAKRNPNGTWSAFTAIPAAPIPPTAGHQFTNPAVNFGGEHFGVGFMNVPTAVRYFWLIDDGAGNLIHGQPVNVSTPIFNYNPPIPAVAPAVVVAVVVPPPPPAPPVLQFGEATWVKAIKTTTHNNNKIPLKDLVSDDPGKPQPWANGEPDQVEVEWRILQTGGVNDLLAGAPEEMPNGDEVITRRYEFYKYTGPLDAESGQAMGDTVGAKAADGIHYMGTGSVTYNDHIDPITGEWVTVTTDLSKIQVVGDFIGAQMAAVDVNPALGLIDNIQSGDVGVAYADRTVVVPGPFLFTATVKSGALPDGLKLGQFTGVLSGTPTTPGTFNFTVEVSDIGPTISKAYTVTITGVAVPPTYTVATSAVPVAGGVTAGDGIYNDGDSVTVNATANPGYYFRNWTEAGAVVSSLPGYTFNIGMDRTLTANFALIFTVSLNSAPPSPTLTNAPVTFTASATSSGTPEYKFRVGTVVGGVTTWAPLPIVYTTNPVFTWTPTVAGTYNVMVYAREQGTTVVKWTPAITYTVKDPLSALALTVTPASPQPWDKTLTLTAVATGGAKLEYKFRASYRDANNVLQWVLLRDYAATPNWSGKLPQDAGRTYTLYAYAREQGTTVNYLLYSPAQTFTTKSPISALALAVTPASPQPWDRTLTLTATATGGVKPEYQFKATYLDATGALVKVLLQDYSPAATWTGKLDQTTGHVYTLYAYTREQGMTVAYLKTASLLYTTKPPISALTISVTPPVSSALGAIITVTATPSGGVAPEYQFKATYLDATGALVKLLLQDYGPAASWTGALPNDVPRTYTLYAYVREHSTTVAYLKSASQAYTTKPPLSALALAVSPALPQLITSAITLTATPTGGVKPEYRFQASYVDATGATQVVLLRDYAAAPTWSGKVPQDAPRNYLLLASAREQGTMVDALVSAPSVPFTTRPPLTALAMRVTPASPLPVATPITVEAIPTGGLALEYQFKATYLDATGALVKVLLQDYSPTASWSGNLFIDAPRAYTLYIYAREQGTTIAYLKSVSQPFVTK